MARPKRVDDGMNQENVEIVDFDGDRNLVCSSGAPENAELPKVPSIKEIIEGITVQPRDWIGDRYAPHFDALATAERNSHCSTHATDPP